MYSAAVSSCCKTINVQEFVKETRHVEKEDDNNKIFETSPFVFYNPIIIAFPMYEIDWLIYKLICENAKWYSNSFQFLKYIFTILSYKY